MAYNAAAVALRQCRAITRDGRACRAWAVWDDPRQLCMTHAGRHHTGPMSRFAPNPGKPAAYRPCGCAAYAWPHRPGGGLCRWPHPPLVESTIPAGTRRFGYGAV